MTKTSTRVNEPFIDLLESYLENLLADSLSRHPRLQAAMSHAVLGGGKRLRPQLIWITGHLADSPDKTALLGAAAAIELLHSYSLIHDDLPAMDDDDFRRGRPSCHREFGEAMAILAGDGLHALAFETFAGAMKASRLKEGARVDLIIEFARVAGAENLVGGQAADLEGREGLTEPECLNWIHERKTAALIRFSLTTGAILAGLPSEDVRRLDEAGRHLGLAFQVTDDVLDLTSNRAQLGKTPGKDRQQDKLTYPELHGIERSREIAEEHLEIALGLLPSGAESGLSELIVRMVRRLS